MDEPPIPKPNTESGLHPSDSDAIATESSQNSNSYPYPNFDGTGLSYYTQEQLKNLLLEKLDFLYNKAISKLVVLGGFEKDVALKGVLKNGHHIYGQKDVFNNVYHNSFGGLLLDEFGENDSSKNSEESKLVFDDLRQLGEHSLDVLVGELQKFKPHLKKGNAMWSLLMSNLDVGQAISMEVPVLRSPRNVESLGENPFSVDPSNAGLGLQTEIENPKRFSLSPKKKSLLRKNVAILAAGFKSKLKNLEAQSNDEEIRNLDTQDGVNSVLGDFRDLNLDENFNVGEDQKDDEVVLRLINEIKDLEREVKEMKERVQEQEIEAQSHDREIRNLDNQFILGNFRDLNLDENVNVGEDQKVDAMILRMIDEIKDLERQVKEKKEWAQEKAIQAAKKLSGDLIELRVLRLEVTAITRLSDMEYDMRKTNEAVRKLEAEKAEIIAEMEAIKLSASEADSNSLDANKREKKYQKRITGCEKQKAKLEEEIEAEKRKIAELKQELARIKDAQKEAEARWWQEQKAKELAQEQVVEERRLKKESVINSKRKLEALSQDIAMEFKIHDDDLQRLEKERSRSKLTSQPAEVLSKSDSLSQPKIAGKEIIGDRMCMFCNKNQVSVVYLPCAHQVLCASCDDLNQTTGNALCLHCGAGIEQRIQVLGVSS